MHYGSTKSSEFKSLYPPGLFDFSKIIYVQSLLYVTADTLKIDVQGHRVKGQNNSVM